ncbi:Ger(x)C family spore germination protein [Alteribacter natronophilus]|uniref:Ger(x)C family spore germination protein n=1 Tax=Alteribacter natronophilus TaxID=2583810 RepID=UPI00110D5A11|nr:Ger(x)C family spore germination protein [Alteribacter natronophilus]TMW71016.1 Ger(x)C family spore germination protein [Alteribacter natronophilus]
MREKGILLLALLMLIGSVSGCAMEDAREIDHRTMIIAFGIEKGEEQEYKVTIQVPIMTAIGAEEGVNLNEFKTFSQEGDSILDAVAGLESRTPTVLFFGHLKVVAISEELAQKGLGDLIDFVGRRPPLSNQVYLMIIEEPESVEGFLATESPLISLPALYLDRFFHAEQKISRTDESRLFEFIRDYNMISEASTLPMAHSADHEIVIENLAVFKKENMVAELKGKEVGMSRLLKEEEVLELNYTVPISSGGKVVDASIRLDLRAEVDYETNNPVHFNINVNGVGELVDMADMEVNTTEDVISEIEKKLAAQVERELRSTISKMQEINVEPWLLGHRVWAMDHKYFETLEWDEGGWQEAEFTIEADIEMTKLGQRGMHTKKKIGR